LPEDVAPHFIANYAAFAAGRPLRNVIDLTRQYWSAFIPGGMLARTNSRPRISLCYRASTAIRP